MKENGAVKSKQEGFSIFNFCLTAFFILSFVVISLVSYGAYLVNMKYGGPISSAHWTQNTIDTSLFRYTRVKTNGISLNVLEAGNSSATKKIVLLHGFPETALLSYHSIISLLIEKSSEPVHIIAPDQRGYNTSDKPEGIAAYQLDTLVNDIIGLFDAYDIEKAHLVGHDWGAIVAWRLALVFPNRVQKLVNLNVPHPQAMRDYLPTHPSQWQKSWYIFFFQFPALAEYFFARENFKFGTNLLAQSSLASKTFSSDDVRRIHQAWSEEGALTAMINWYRALRYRTHFEDPRVQVPTLLIWGEKDIALEAEMADLSINYCPLGKLIKIPSATHWVIHDEPERVSDEITSFFA